MKHCYWTYVGDVGVSQKVGLLHGQKTGHLIIYCGKKILIVDFKVRHSKTYSFFINDELCEVILERKGDTMHYSFNIDKKTDTPRNRARKKLERKYDIQTFLFFAVLFAAIAAFFMAANSFVKKPNADDLLSEMLLKRETIGEVLIDYENNQPSAISYHFVVQNDGYSVESNLSDTSLIILKNGMPLESGDEFMVEYSLNDPKQNSINYDRPTKKQLIKYRERVIEKHKKLHPDLPTYLVQCIVDVVYELNGLKGFSDFYFQDFSPAQNPRNNSSTYLKLTRDVPFNETMERKCW